MKSLQVIKSNLGRFPEPLGMEVNGQGVVFGNAPSPPRNLTATDQAAELLLTILSKSPVRVLEIYDEIEGAGLSKKSAQRAKKKLGIVSKKNGTYWYWSLPAIEEPQMFDDYPPS